MEKQSSQMNENLQEMEDMASKALKHGLNHGASELEIKLNHGFQRSVEIKANSISGIQQQSKTLISVRSYIGKKMGIASATALTPKTIEETVDNAIKLAKRSPPDDNFISLAKKVDRNPIKVKGLYDENLSLLDPSDVVTSLKLMVDSALEIEKRSIVGGGLQLNDSEVVVLNSNGISKVDKTTSMSLGSFVSIPLSTSDVGSGGEFYLSRKWENNFDFGNIGKVAAEKAVKTLGSQKIESDKMPVILDEKSTFQTLSRTIGIGVNGYMVMSGMSYFSDKIGEELGVNELNLWDDPHVDEGYSSKIYDAEGTPTTKVSLFKNGILENYVTDSYTSNKMGIENTGNAGSGFGSKIPRPTIHQLQMDAGSDSSDQMLEDMKKGLYIESGLNAFSMTPDISAKLTRAFYVENGEIKYAIKNAMLGTNVFEMLKGINGISKELLVEYGHQSPKILIGEVSIASAGEDKKGGPPVSMGAM